MRDWVSDIYRAVSEYKAFHPKENIIIQVSPLMRDFLYCRLVESDPYMKVTIEKRRKDTELPMNMFLFGERLELVDDTDLLTFRVIGVKRKKNV